MPHKNKKHNNNKYYKIHQKSNEVPWFIPCSYYKWHYYIWLMTFFLFILAMIIRAASHTIGGFICSWILYGLALAIGIVCWLGLLIYGGSRGCSTYYTYWWGGVGWILHAIALLVLLFA